MNSVKRTLQRLLPESWWGAISRLVRLLRWLLGRPVPPPHIVKRRAIKKYGQQFGTQTFVETGTLHGDMVHAMRDRFTQIYTIELDRALYERASQRFAANAHIHVIHGDSAEELPKVLDRVSEPCLFWLDAHYSAGITAHGPLETPIIKELTAILRHRQSHQVILIDDARNFNGSRDYPTLTWLQEFVKSEKPNYVCEVSDDLIRIHPPAALPLASSVR